MVILQLRKHPNPVQEAALALGRCGLIEWERVKTEGTLSERALDGRLGSGSPLTLSTTAGCSVPCAIPGRLPRHKGEGRARLLPSEERTTPEIQALPWKTVLQRERQLQIQYGSTEKAVNGSS